MKPRLCEDRGEPGRARAKGRARVNQRIATALASLAALALAASLPVGRVAAQGWWNPWGGGPPVPREPMRQQPVPPPAQPPPAYSPPPPPGGQSYGGSQSYGGRSPICAQLEQRLVSESRNSQASEMLPRIENDMRLLERTIRSTEQQLDRSNCYEYEFLVFGKSLRRDPACRNLASQVDASKRRLAELDAQRQQILQTGGRSLRDDIVRELARNSCGAQYQQEAARSSGPFSSLW